MRLKFTFNRLLLCSLFFSFTMMAMAQQIQPSALKQIQSLADEKESRTSSQKKLNSQLWYAIKMDRGEAITSEVATLDVNVNKDAGGSVPVEIHGIPSQHLLQAIRNAGGEIIFSSAVYNRITANIPLPALERLADMQDVKFIDMAIPPSHAGKSIWDTRKKEDPTVYVGVTAFKQSEIMQFRPGFLNRAERVRSQVINSLKAQGYTVNDQDFIGSVTSQGDNAHKAASARTTFSINGSGVKIGVLSDSYDTRSTGLNAIDDVNNGDLPGPTNPNGFTTAVTVLSDFAGGTDEGRAMMQIVHDLAPGAQLYFATAFTSEASFASNITALRTAGCDIICDDVFYYDEPPFQDGIVAQAVNGVTTAGASYFSSAGNQGNKTDNTASVWEGDFADAGTFALLPGGNLHDFGGANNSNALTTNGANRLFLFWSDPQGGSANDYDLYVLNSTLTAVSASSTTVQSGTQDPIEFITSARTTGQRIVIFKKTAAATRALHLNIFGAGMSFNTFGQTHGHGSAANAFSVAATPAAAAFCGGYPAGPSPGAFTVANNKVECFSSDGPRRKFYDPAGVPITAGNFLFGTNGGQVLQKPDITAADGVVTTLPVGSGLNPFYGTSAAAPHAAAIAGLLKSYRPAITAAQIRTALIASAIDIESAGVDRNSGVGIVMALEALQSVTGPTVTINQAAAQADPTSISPINFTVVFSAAVTGFTNTDVTLSGTAGATTVVVTGSGTTYNVAVSGMTSSGTVIASIPANAAIDASSNGNSASTSTDNTVTYNLVAVGPTVTIEQAAAQADPTSTSPINFTVVFSAPVTGFTTGDVTLTGTAGATTGTVTGSGTTYNVAVSGMTSTGTVIASVPANVAVDASSNGNSASTSIDHTVQYNNPAPPSVTINQAAAQPDPTTVSPINFTVVFSEAVTGFTNTDVTLSGTALPTTAVVTGSGTTYNVAVSGMTASGLVTATVPANGANNAAGTGNLASTSTDNNVTYNLSGSCTSTVSYTGPAVAIPDNNPTGITVSLPVSGLGAVINDLDFRFDAAPSGTCDATVGNTNAAVDHTFIGDLIFTLTSPGGTSVIIVNRRGGTRENICTTLLDDDGGYPSLSTVTSVSGQTLNGNFSPDNPLSAFDGQNPNGTWTLNVSDNAGVDIGSLRRFSLLLTTPCIPCVITCPANITRNTDPNQCGAVVTYPAPTTTGTCGVVTSIPASGSFFPKGTTTVNVTSTSGQTCSFTVTVNDNQAPTITCPASTTVSCASAVPAPNVGSVTATDNCPGVVVTHVSDVISAQTCANRYLVTRTYRATDAVGNVSNCTQTITVNDVTAPVLTCPSNITVTTPVGSCTIPVTYAPTATDNCSGAVTVVSVPASGSVFPIGTTTVTTTATDVCGNVSTCTFTVTVIDAQLPVITAQPANRTTCSGSTATFSVTATNATAYQWQQWNGSAWVNIAGATSSTLTITNVNVSMNTNSFRVNVTGLCTTVTSNFATLYVNALPMVTLTSSIPPVLLPGQSLTLTAVVSPAGGTFVWFKNGVVIPGATGNTLSGLTVDDIGTYRVVYTDPNGCVSTSGDLTISGQPSGNVFVYPNPNRGQFQVRFFNQTNEKATVNIYDDKGAKVYSQALVTTTPYTRVDVTSNRLPAGTYLVEVINSAGKRIGAKRIVVNH